ncbi:SoxY-related AACIE arm protein [Belnapia rosea]|jgi:sulfur-oxidizing protein SoxY|uniref:SoxY-related AACIE arm protein n=1 Tax=Belnapia rosea TaxID=938405 RepID=UPI00088DB8A3|nr:SoxY-related AACIE arm protein [Belnapia rosea]SDB73543.1 sulfur-oxidizing protein SoxY [Belnapia rosea]
MSWPSSLRSGIERRALGAGLLAVALLRPARAERPGLREAILAFTGGAEPAEGQVTLEIPPLVENGNTVPVTIAVESPMTEADHVRRIALFNERNPQPNVVTARLGPRAGRARLATRMRLATSQRLVAVAEMSDGRFRSASADVIVTLAACVEG